MATPEQIPTDLTLEIGADLRAGTVSIALQFGADTETIRAVLTRDHDDGPAMALGAALDAIAGEPP